VIDYENFITPSDSKHLKMGDMSPPNPQKKTAMKSKCPCNPKTLNLLYLANPKFLGKNNSTTGFKTLGNGG